MDTTAKMALRKTIDAIRGGKMKPGDSMIVKGKSEVLPALDAGADDSGELEIATELCHVLGCDEQVAGDLKDLLSEFIQRCMAKEHI